MNTFSHSVRSKKRLIIPILVLVGAGVIGKVLASFEKPPEKKDLNKTTPIVTVKALKVGAMTLDVTSQGFVKPKYETNLVAQVSGELVSISPAFVRGGIVREGDIIARIDPSNYQVIVEDAKAKLAGALAALELEQAQVSVAKQEWKNINIKGANPTALSLRKPQLKQARASVNAAKAALARAEKDLSRTKIRAPYDALVESRDVSKGSFANIGTRLGKVLQLSSAEVRLPIPNTQLQYMVADGIHSAVDLSADINGVRQFWPATIVRTEGVIDEQSRMIFLVAEIQDPYQLENTTGINTSSKPLKRLRFGTYVSASIQGKAIDQAAKIERRFFNDGNIAVFDDGKLRMIPVNLIRNQGHHSIIKGELKGNEQLIISALDFPVDGMPLELNSSAVEQKNVQQKNTGGQVKNG